MLGGCNMSKNTQISDDTKKAVVRYFIENQSTVRKTAKVMRISKTSVHLILRASSSKEVQDILEQNKKERHLRGGMMTKLKYLNMKQKN